MRFLTPAGPSKREGKPRDTKNGISKTPSSANSADAFSRSRKFRRYSLRRVFASDIGPPLLDVVSSSHSTSGSVGSVGKGHSVAAGCLQCGCGFGLGGGSGEGNRRVKKTCDVGDEQTGVLEQ